MPRVVYVPNTVVSQGMGHLQRCRAAVRNSPGTAALWLCLDTKLTEKPVFDAAKLERRTDVPVLSDWPETLVLPVVVVDFQKTPQALLQWLRPRAELLLGWDEGGSARAQFAFLVDSLPHATTPEPNVRLPGLLGLAAAASLDPARFERPIGRVLVVFGGADPAGLTLKFLRSWKRWKRPELLTVVKGPLASFNLPGGFAVLEAPDGLQEHLRHTDLVVTSWGLTALEALAAATPVLLFNPSAYHEDLSRAAGLTTLGNGVVSSRQFDQLTDLAKKTSALAAVQLLPAPLDASGYFEGFTGLAGGCPVCRTKGHEVFARTEHKSYHRCSDCGLEYLSVFQLPAPDYSDAYFFEAYQSQYGKTYLEDFDHIEELGRQRLEFLAKLTGNVTSGAVLDVGCAFGPFLAAAARQGAKPYGLDIAASAVAYVTDILGFPAVQGSWLDFDWNTAFPDVPRPGLVTLWYVIEHFPDLNAVLRGVSATLEVGGLFAFGTPNGQGLTRRFRGNKFWIDSPDDHFSVWNRANAQTVLARYGFEVLGFRNTGLHPQRFPGVKGKGLRFHLVRLFGERLGWGDTFEVYARKVRELP